MKLVFYFRKYHKWLALVIGIQALIWGLSGLYMTAVHIDYVHGDHLVKPQAPINLSNFEIKPLDPEFLSSLGEIKRISLTSVQQQPVYSIVTKSTSLQINAVTLKLLVGLDEKAIRQIANKIYAGNSQIATVKLLDSYPRELGGRKQPIWLVEFDDWLESSLYLLPETGQLRSKRSNLWRIFDFLWMLHIMDYENRVDINNNLLMIASSFGGLLVLSGLGLLFFSFKNQDDSSLTVSKQADQ
jgi:hypothetical protein